MPDTVEVVEFKTPRGVFHCWEDGPLAGDGCPTTCRRADRHFGSHEFIRDDEIVIRFAKGDAK